MCLESDPEVNNQKVIQDSHYEGTIRCICYTACRAIGTHTHVTASAPEGIPLLKL
jgi:hypothetical protein